MKIIQGSFLERRESFTANLLNVPRIVREGIKTEESWHAGGVPSSDEVVKKVRN